MINDQIIKSQDNQKKEWRNEEMKKRRKEEMKKWTKELMNKEKNKNYK